MKKLFLCAAAAMLALVGCEKQVQSSISLADVDMVAHVKGALVFDAAQAGIDTKVDTLANQRVYFIVNANLYDANANATDKRSFEATTDAHGQFDITVPAGSKQIQGELRTDVIKIEKDGKTIFLKETVKPFTLYAGDNKFDKIICYVDELLSACQGRATVNGRVVYDPGIITKNGHKEKGVLAAEGATVCLLARYDKAGLSEKLGTDSVKLFTIKTDKDGFFTEELPVSNDNTKAVDVDVTVSNFDAKFIDEINGNEVPRDAKFAKTAPITVSLKDGNFIKVAEAGKDVIELDRVWIAPITTATTTFKVKGELKLDAEEQTFGTGDYVNMITGVKKGSTEYTNKINGGAFTLEVKHVVSGTVLSTIILDCNTKADGTFAEDVTVYDDWKSGDIQIFLNIKKFVVNDYVHFYKGAIYKNKKWDEFPTDWCDYDATKKKIKTDYTETQECPGFYEYDGSAKPYAWDGTFDVNVGTVQAGFTMDPTFAKNELLGVGNVVGGKNIDEDEDGNQIAGNGLSY